MNPASGELFKQGKRVKLQEQPLRLLTVLLENPGEVVSREEIQKRIWPDNTFVDFDSGLRVAVRKLREVLGDDAKYPRYIETIPKRGYRLLVPATRTVDPTDGFVASQASSAPERHDANPTSPNSSSAGGSSKSRTWIIAAVLPVIVLAAAAFLFLARGSRKLTEADTIVLADFVNSTGNPVFDGTLRQGLAVQLEQSPLLSMISEQRIQDTLRLMGQPPDARLTPDIAYSLCRRTQSAAVISGSITNLGNQYVVGLKAVSCRAGELLSEQQETAVGKEQVLAALGKASVKLRARLGESLTSVRRFDTMLPEATTPSLEALQAYAKGMDIAKAGEFANSVAFFQRAIELDPNFALAYAALGSQYSNLNETTLAREYVRKAYELRTRVTERERFLIEAAYYSDVTGDLEKARQVYEIEAATYPRDYGAPLRLWVIYSQIGQLDKGLAQIRESIRRDPTRTANYGQLVAAYTYLNELDEARTTAQQALAKRFDTYPLRIQLYRLDFLDNDATGMESQVKWGAGREGLEDQFLEQEADTAAYAGELERSREFSRQAVASALRVQKKETAAVFEGRAALCEALLGNMKEARLEAESVWGQGHSGARNAGYSAMLAMAMAGNTIQAQHWADNFSRRFPEDTLVQFHYLPTVYAQIALSRGQARKAIEILRATIPYELGALTVPLYMAPSYVRGTAYLADHQGAAAANEFQKIIDRRGIVRNHLVGALAHLQLGRAYAMTGDKLKAKAAYDDFLHLWKGADSDVVVLKQAKAEYKKLM